MMNDKDKVDRVKKIFEHYRTSGDWDITEEEYDKFCDWVAYLKDEHIVEINEEIYFVVLGTAEDGLPTFANTVLLETEKLKNKKAIVFLSPLVFRWDLPPMPSGHPAYPLVHEIAHGILRREPKNREERDFFELEADELVKRWFEDP